MSTVCQINTVQSLSLNSKKGSVLVIDNHPICREAIVRVLTTLNASSVVTASTVETGLLLATNIADLRLILLDFTLPGISGVEAVVALRRTWPDVRLIVISASEDRRNAAAALRAGAELFVSKTVATDVLTDILRSALADELSGPPQWIAPRGEAVIFNESLSELLTPRQRQILVFLSDGHSNKEIGLRLGLSEVTVKRHVSAIFRRFQVTNRTQAVLVARRIGLTDGTIATKERVPVE